MVERGTLVEESLEESIKWLKMAANQGYADAEFSLGVRYRVGRAFLLISKKPCHGYPQLFVAKINTGKAIKPLQQIRLKKLKL